MVNNGLRYPNNSNREGESRIISALFAQIRSAKNEGLSFHHVTDFGFAGVTPGTLWRELPATAIIILRALFRFGIPHKVTNQGLRIPSSQKVCDLLHAATGEAV